MRITGLLAAVPLIAGAVWGTFGAPPAAALVVLPILCVAGAAAWTRRGSRTTPAVIASGFFVAGTVLAADAREEALHPSLRAVLDANVGRFAIDTLGPEADHDPILVRAVIEEDASARDGFVSLRAGIINIFVGRTWQPAAGGASLSVSGDAAAAAAPEWRAGRTIEFPATFRRPARYLNDGVADMERALALDGIALFGSVKSALLVDVVSRGSPLDEFAADVRAHVRDAIARHVTRHGAVAGAIVTAVLIGDRTGLPDDVRDRLQAAGTYHVIAISGGNIAILATVIAGMLAAAGIRGRAAAFVTISALVVYANIATAGPSVWRATLMAVLYLGARLLDHRTAPWQAAAVAAAAMVVARPLDIRDAGFLLTFGATAALLEGARLGYSLLPARRVLRWMTASVAASLAAELTLLPVSAQMFSRVTSAGLVLNLIAVPVMGAAQVAGLVAVVGDAVDGLATAAGWTAFNAAKALVDSARLVDIAPWLTSRVPPPGFALVLTYYASLGVLVYARPRKLRLPAAVVLTAAVLCASGAARAAIPSTALSGLRLTMFDVGQGEAMLLDADGQRLQIDAGGAPFGRGSFDIGARVLTPALWARDVHSLDALLVTHGDPDHIGGAMALVEDFGPRRFWEGIQVPRHLPSRQLRDVAAAAAARAEVRRGGEAVAWGRGRLRVLHPPEPDWERPRVRNDDSVVLEVIYGDVALLLTGDISAEVERTILPLLTPAPIRILKVAHHGSRTSTSRAMLETWRPHFALISAGRGNSFGHPTPEVLARLETIGAQVFRTDRHGQITVETDGREVRIRTFVGGER